MAMVDVGLQLAGGLTAQVGWLGLKVGGRLALPYICQMNRVNSQHDSTINVVRVLLLLLLLLYDWGKFANFLTNFIMDMKVRNDYG